MTPDEALVALGESTAAAVAGVLRESVDDGLEHGTVAVVGPGASPFADLPLPAVATSVTYLSSVTVFALGSSAARRVAASITGQDPTAESELGETDLSAVGEALHEAMAAAVAAKGAALGREVDLSTPQTILLAAREDAPGAYPETPHATTVGFSLLGEPCLLIQLVPSAFVETLTLSPGPPAGQAGDHPPAVGATVTGDNLRSVPLRVWAELGRTRLPLSRAVGLPPGSVVELDARADDPVDVFVSGRRFAQGALVLAEDGEWAVRVDRLLLASNAIANDRDAT